jgi:hypothetical protein
VKTPGWASLRGPLDAFDLAVLLAFAFLSVWLLLLLVWDQSADHMWIGTDGPVVGDQVQYVAWVRESARHVLIANPFKLETSAANFLHPGLVLSGAATHIGVAPWIAYLLWKPVAVVSLFGAVRAYAWRVLSGTAQRRCALILALFHVAPAAALGEYLDLTRQLIALQTIVWEMWPGLYLWGYPFTAIAIAALAGALLSYERDRKAGRVSPWTPLLGLVCAWLQPWQGATLLAILVVSEIILWRLDPLPRPALLAATLLATVAPLCYYALLSRFDPSWALAGEANRIGLFRWWTLGFSLAPLALPAALAYPRRTRNFQDVAVRVWAPAAIAIYGIIGITRVGTFPLHALQGLSIPLAVLAVAGVSRVGRRLRPAAKLAIGAFLVALLTVPALARELNRARMLATADDPIAIVFGAAGAFVNANERDAFDYLEERPDRGGVLSSRRLGQMVPAETGRHTWVGLMSWTPDLDQRARLADALLAGQLAPSDARSLVRSSGARFVLSDCTTHADLTGVLRRMLASVRHFGCVTVYRVRR